MNNPEETKLIKKLLSIPILLLILFAWATPTMADTGYELSGKIGTLAYSVPIHSSLFATTQVDKIRCAVCHLSKSADYGGDASNSADAACSDDFKITVLIKPDKTRFRLVSLNDLVSDNREHYPIE